MGTSARLQWCTELRKQIEEGEATKTKLSFSSHTKIHEHEQSIIISINRCSVYAADHITVQENTYCPIQAAQPTPSPLANNSSKALRQHHLFSVSIHCIVFFDRSECSGAFVESNHEIPADWTDAIQRCIYSGDVISRMWNVSQIV